MSATLLQTIFFAVFLVAGVVSVSDFKINIDKILDQGAKLEDKLITSILITPNCTGGEIGTSEFKIEAPLALVEKSPITLYFANDSKAYLEIVVSNDPPKAEATFYVHPYSLLSKPVGSIENIDISTSDDQWNSTFTVEGAWFPEKTSRVSGSVKIDNNAYYSTYGIRNFGISLPDVLVVDNFKKFNCARLVDEEFDLDNYTF